MMRLSILAAVIVAALAQRASAIGPSCDTETASGTGDVCISGGEELNTQSFKLSFLDPQTGSLCTDADKGEGSMWIAHDFDAYAQIGALGVLCTGNADMNPEPGGSLVIIPRGTVLASARRTAALEQNSANYSSEFACSVEADGGRIMAAADGSAPLITWCHWNGATADVEYLANGDGNGGLATTADATATCTTGVFSNGATVASIGDYVSDQYTTVITATVSFTAIVANTFTIKAKIDGVQVGTDVKCSAAAGFSTSCTISILDVVDDPDHSFTVTAAQSTGILNTVDTCNVTRLSVHD